MTEKHDDHKPKRLQLDNSAIKDQIRSQAALLAAMITKGLDEAALSPPPQYI